MKRALPIGNDQFPEIRNRGLFYIDKTLLIRDFIKFQNMVTLITRPRRFGKTVNMTMLREFFDITKDSRGIFEGLKIMDTEYSAMLNSSPVIFFSFKDCSGSNEDELRVAMIYELLNEYARYYDLLKDRLDMSDMLSERFVNTFNSMKQNEIGFDQLCFAVKDLIQVVYKYWKIPVILLIDEYDQPIMSSYENGYRLKLRNFFEVFFGSALKGCTGLDKALLTGVQRVVKESIFSKLNNVSVYTVKDKRYSEYFGLTVAETEELLEYCNLSLNDEVKGRYDGYRFAGTEIYNPFSVFKYADTGELKDYWVNTSTNTLVNNALRSADRFFMEQFEKLVAGGSAEVGINLETSFIELEAEDTLWGLLVNSGYLTIVEDYGDDLVKVAVPNGEVRSEFRKIVANYVRISDTDLKMMFRYLTDKRFDEFKRIYQKLVITCTSNFDAKENAYHMLFLGMCITLQGEYEIQSNIESGLGRSDITLKAKRADLPNVIIEFKQGSNIEKLKQEALQQIHNKQYYANLTGEILCVGIAHNKKECALGYEVIRR